MLNRPNNNIKYISCAITAASLAAYSIAGISRKPSSPQQEQDRPNISANAMVERAHTNLVLCGSNITQEAALKFTELSGGRNAKLLYIPWSNDDKKKADEFVKQMSLFGPVSIEVAPYSYEMKGKLEIFKKQLKNATGLFFSGGDQKYGLSIIRKYELEEPILELFLNGVVVGGKSAGSALVPGNASTGKPFLDKNGDDLLQREIDPRHVEFVRGINVLPKCLIETHFLWRMHFNRLFSSLFAAPEELDIALDIGSAVTITNNRIVKVISDGQVTVVNQNSDDDHHFDVDFMKKGESYDLVKKRKINGRN
jgi:cyanophycinase